MGIYVCLLSSFTAEPDAFLGTTSPQIPIWKMTPTWILMTTIPLLGSRTTKTMVGKDKTLLNPTTKIFLISYVSTRAESVTVLSMSLEMKVTSRSNNDMTIKCISKPYPSSQFNSQKIRVI